MATGKKKSNTARQLRALKKLDEVPEITTVEQAMTALLGVALQSRDIQDAARDLIALRPPTSRVDQPTMRMVAVSARQGAIIQGLLNFFQRNAPSMRRLKVAR